MKNSNLIELVKENPNLPIFAWVNFEVVGGDCNYWLGSFSKAEIKEYAKVEPYGYNDQVMVFKDDYEDYLQYLIDSDLENKTEEELSKEIENMDYKKAIFVYVDLPDDL